MAEVETVRMPGPMRMVWGSLVAYWLSGIINPAFVAIAVLIVLYIPIIVIDPYFPNRKLPTVDLDLPPPTED